MKPNKAINLLKPLYYKVDNDLKDIPSVCKKGCSYCCYQPIELLKIEKITLAKYINSELNTETKQQIKEKVAEWLNFFDNNTPNKELLSGKEAFEYVRFRAENIPLPCPLLINDECSVYKVRPLTCRIHFVNDSKEFCEKNKLRDGSRESYLYRINIVNELKTKIEVEIIPLAYALVEILKIDRSIKKIEKSILR